MLQRRQFLINRVRHSTYGASSPSFRQSHSLKDELSEGCKPFLRPHFMNPFSSRNSCFESSQERGAQALEARRGISSNQVGHPKAHMPQVQTRRGSLARAGHELTLRQGLSVQFGLCLIRLHLDFTHYISYPSVGLPDEVASGSFVAQGQSSFGKRHNGNWRG